MVLYDKNVVQSVGLWYAEGDKKTISEINFCNNCFELVEFFHKTITNLFSDDNYNIRIYVYTPDGVKINVPIDNCKFRFYTDKKATKPYYIWRLASVKLNKLWKNIVNDIISNEIYYIDFLKGFFAGEGNIKTGSHGTRAVRISQGKPLKFLEKMMKKRKLTFYFAPRERSYVLTSKSNWDILANIKIADLHPIRKVRFWNVYNSFKQEHYPLNYLKNKVLCTLNKPKLKSQLSIKFKRSEARICDVLIELKKEGLITDFRVRSNCYWIKNDKNLIIVSKLKKKYLAFLDYEGKTTKLISNKFKVCWKSANNRLNELETLGLAYRKDNKEWVKINTCKKVIAK